MTLDGTDIFVLGFGAAVIIWPRASNWYAERVAARQRRQFEEAQALSRAKMIELRNSTRLRVVKVGTCVNSFDGIFQGIVIKGWTFEDADGNRFDEYAASNHPLFLYTADDLREIAARPAEFTVSD